MEFERTLITLTMEYEPEGFLEMAGDVLGIPSGQVEEDLNRFGISSNKQEEKQVAGEAGSEKHLTRPRMPSDT